ncbi:Maf family protein [Longivirga aurantiaca]|uniref:Nucleoside triphosphate pyrophosphatase n=1 Tax=Longivirga aurantiaca TaxID=1837743 RepID=A0ABW1SZ51_9ACTN
MTPHRPLVLASASPARLALLRGAGIEPTVRVSGVDEPAIEAALAAEGRSSPADVCEALAIAKGKAVLADVRAELPAAVLVACDSVLDLDGVALGKPADAAEAAARWRAMRGRTGVLRTGHYVVRLDRLGERPATGPVATSHVVSTTVRFADLDDATIEAYVGTGEPLRVAGAFTIDGIGGPFVEELEGDHTNVVGLSLPFVRSAVESLDIRWTDLWNRT